jgi:hypothetical protein
MALRLPLMGLRKAKTLSRDAESVQKSRESKSRILPCFPEA